MYELCHLFLALSEWMRVRVRVRARMGVRWHNMCKCACTHYFVCSVHLELVNGEGQG